MSYAEGSGRAGRRRKGKVGPTGSDVGSIPEQQQNIHTSGVREGGWMFYRGHGQLDSSGREWHRKSAELRHFREDDLQILELVDDLDLVILGLNGQEITRGSQDNLREIPWFLEDGETVNWQPRADSYTVMPIAVQYGSNRSHRIARILIDVDPRDLRPVNSAAASVGTSTRSGEELDRRRSRSRSRSPQSQLQDQYGDWQPAPRLHYGNTSGRGGGMKDQTYHGSAFGNASTAMQQDFNELQISEQRRYESTSSESHESLSSESMKESEASQASTRSLTSLGTHHSLESRATQSTQDSLKTQDSLNSFDSRASKDSLNSFDSRASRSSSEPRHSDALTPTQSRRQGHSRTQSTSTHRRPSSRVRAKRFDRSDEQHRTRRDSGESDDSGERTLVVGEEWVGGDD